MQRLSFSAQFMSLSNSIHTHSRENPLGMKNVVDNPHRLLELEFKPQSTLVLLYHRAIYLLEDILFVVIFGRFRSNLA